MCGRDSIDLMIYFRNVHLMDTYSGMIPKTMSMNDVTSYMTICGELPGRKLFASRLGKGKSDRLVGVARHFPSRHIPLSFSYRSATAG